MNKEEYAELAGYILKLNSLEPITEEYITKATQLINKLHNEYNNYSSLCFKLLFEESIKKRILYPAPTLDFISKVCKLMRLLEETTGKTIRELLEVPEIDEEKLRLINLLKEKINES